MTRKMILIRRAKPMMEATAMPAVEIPGPEEGDGDGVEVDWEGESVGCAEGAGGGVVELLEEELDVVEFEIVVEIVDDEDVELLVVLVWVDEAIEDDGVDLEWVVEVDVSSVAVVVGEDLEDFEVLDVLVGVALLSVVDVSTGSTVSEVAAAVAVTGSRRLSIALSTGSKRKDMLIVRSQNVYS